MYGKATTHLVRLCGVINSLNKTTSFLMSSGLTDISEENISDDLKVQIQNFSRDDQFRKKFSIIDYKTVKQANKLLKYFNANRIALADYKLDFNETGIKLNYFI